MILTKQKVNILRGLLLVLSALPLIATTNIDCHGKAFHCVNSTHFMICVDIGRGFSSTIDDFTIPCPTNTECRMSNRFECEYPPPTASTLAYRTTEVTTTSQQDETIIPSKSDNIVLQTTINPSNEFQSNVGELTTLDKSVTIESPILSLTSDNFATEKGIIENIDHNLSTKETTLPTSDFKLSVSLQEQTIDSTTTTVPTPDVSTTIEITSPDKTTIVNDFSTHLAYGKISAKNTVESTTDSKQTFDITIDSSFNRHADTAHNVKYYATVKTDDTELHETSTLTVAITEINILDNTNIIETTKSSTFQTDNTNSDIQDITHTTPISIPKKYENNVDTDSSNLANNNVFVSETVTSPEAVLLSFTQPPVTQTEPTTYVNRDTNAEKQINASNSVTSQLSLTTSFPAEPTDTEAITTTTGRDVNTDFTETPFLATTEAIVHKAPTTSTGRYYTGSNFNINRHTDFTEMTTVEITGNEAITTTASSNYMGFKNNGIYVYADFTETSFLTTTEATVNEAARTSTDRDYTGSKNSGNNVNTDFTETTANEAITTTTSRNDMRTKSNGIYVNTDFIETLFLTTTDTLVNEAPTTSTGRDYPGSINSGISLNTGHTETLFLSTPEAKPITTTTDGDNMGSKNNGIYINTDLTETTFLTTTETLVNEAITNTISRDYDSVSKKSSIYLDTGYTETPFLTSTESKANEATTTTALSKNIALYVKTDFTETPFLKTLDELNGRNHENTAFPTPNLASDANEFASYGLVATASPYFEFSSKSIYSDLKSDVGLTSATTTHKYTTDSYNNVLVSSSESHLSDKRRKYSDFSYSATMPADVTDLPAVENATEIIPDYFDEVEFNFTIFNSSLSTNLENLTFSEGELADIHQSKIPTGPITEKQTEDIFAHEDYILNTSTVFITSPNTNDNQVTNEIISTSNIADISPSEKSLKRSTEIYNLNTNFTVAAKILEKTNKSSSNTEPNEFDTTVPTFIAKLNQVRESYRPTMGSSIQPVILLTKNELDGTLNNSETVATTDAYTETYTKVYNENITTDYHSSHTTLPTENTTVLVKPYIPITTPRSFETNVESLNGMIQVQSNLNPDKGIDIRTNQERETNTSQSSLELMGKQYTQEEKIINKSGTNYWDIIRAEQTTPFISDTLIRTETIATDSTGLVHIEYKNISFTKSVQSQELQKNNTNILFDEINVIGILNATNNQNYIGTPTVPPTDSLLELSAQQSTEITENYTNSESVQNYVTTSPISTIISSTHIYTDIHKPSVNSGFQGDVFATTTHTLLNTRPEPNIINNNNSTALSSNGSYVENYKSFHEKNNPMDNKLTTEKSTLRVDDTIDATTELTWKHFLLINNEQNVAIKINTSDGISQNSNTSIWINNTDKWTKNILSSQTTANPVNSNQPTQSHSNVQIDKENNSTLHNNVQNVKANFDCLYRYRGRYADSENCRKFYICIGKQSPIIGMCPADTVFSDFRKQCTRNLSHCVRNYIFYCTSEGRFSDLFVDNIYYFCVRNKENKFVRYKLQCEHGYYLDKTSIQCTSVAATTQTTLSDSDNSQKSSDTSSSKTMSNESGKMSNNRDFTCEREGKFADPKHCRKYYVCSQNNKLVFKRKHKSCDSDEVFDKHKLKCVDADSFEC